MRRLGLLLVCAAMPAWADSLPVCTGPDRAERKLTCVVDGDSGWEAGARWRLADVNAPEIDRATCRREQQVGFKARDRLRELMASGYTIERVEHQERFDRDLVRIRLANGRDAGQQLLNEGLAKPWPQTGSKWCGRG